MEPRNRLDENGHPHNHKLQEQKVEVDALKAQLSSLTAENTSLLNALGKMSADLLSLIAYKNKKESCAASCEPTPMALFVLFATMLSNSYGISADEMRKALESL